MNDIEQMFYDAFLDIGEEETQIYPQSSVGIYIADFVIYPDSHIPTIVEIDGHEYHKTKEQRFADYRKERFFMSEGYVVIRFMASEVFVDANKCATEAVHLACLFDEKVIDAFYKGNKLSMEDVRGE